MKRTPLTRHTRLDRGRPMKRSTKVKGRNEKRRKKEWERAYHSAERVAFVKSLRCCASGVKGSIENAHITTGGMSRKADYTQIVPLHVDLHRQLHQIGRATFERCWKINLDIAAAQTQAAWESHCQARRRAPGANE